MTVTEDGVSRGLCAHCLDLHTGLSGTARLARAFRRPRGNEEKCPFCGTTAEQAVRTGLVGCPLCYEALLEPIRGEMGLEPVRERDLW